MDRKQHSIAYLFPPAGLVPLPRKKAAQPFLADGSLDCSPKAPFTRRGERASVEVGAEDLDGRAELMAALLLQQQHGHRIGLFAGGAAANPDSDRLARILVLEQVG